MMRKMGEKLRGNVNYNNFGRRRNSKNKRGRGKILRKKRV